MTKTFVVDPRANRRVGVFTVQAEDLTKAAHLAAHRLFFTAKSLEVRPQPGGEWQTYKIRGRSVTMEPLGVPFDVWEDEEQ